MSSRHRAEIVAAAHEHGLDPDLVEAIVLIESNDRPFAWNPEPRYPYLWDVDQRIPFRRRTPEERASMFPPPDFPCLGGDPDQEYWGQQASWGLMQVMGAVAREQGFVGVYLPQLVDPGINLAYGCVVLAQHLHWAGGAVGRAVAAYNAGRGGWQTTAGQAYAQKVLARYRQIKAVAPEVPLDA